MMRTKKPEVTTVTILGEQIFCQVCNHPGFWRREGKIHSTGLTMLGLDWANASATCLVCEQCGYVHWFLPPVNPPESLESEF